MMVEYKQNSDDSVLGEHMFLRKYHLPPDTPYIEDAVHTGETELNRIWTKVAEVSRNLNKIADRNRVGRAT